MPIAPVNFPPLTELSNGEPATSVVFNRPLFALQTRTDSLKILAEAVETEVTNARGGYTFLLERLNAEIRRVHENLVLFATSDLDIQWDASTNQLVCSGDITIHFPWTTNRNYIRAAQFPISLSADGRKVYVVLNRTVSSDLTVISDVTIIPEPVPSSDMFLFAHRVGDAVYIMGQRWNDGDIKRIGEGFIASDVYSGAVEISAPAGQAVVALPGGVSYSPGTKELQVFINGILIEKDIHYTESSVTEITAIICEIFPEGKFPYKSRLVFRLDALITGGASVPVTGPGGEMNEGRNVGTGEGAIYKQKDVVTLEFRTIKAGPGITVTQSANEITIISQGAVGEANTVSTAGTGTPLFKEKVSSDLIFKSLKVGSNLALQTSSDEITISAVRIGDVDNADNIGATGVNVFKEKASHILYFRKLVAGANTEITQTDDTLVIASTATSGETNDGTNVGSGAGVFKSKTGTTLAFKTLIAGSNVDITSQTDTVTISATVGEVNTASNVGAGFGVFKEKSVSDLRFKSLTAGTNVAIATSGSDEIVISALGGYGEINTASNVGTGTGVFKQKTGVDLEFLKLKAGANVNLTVVSDDIVISSTAVGETNTASNVGTGAGVFAQKIGADLQLKSLKAGSNIAITTSSTEIIISATGGSAGEANTASNIGTGQGVFAQKVGVDLQFYKLLAGSNVTLTKVDNDISISAATSGEVNTGGNVGTGAGVYKDKSGTILRFKSILAGANVTITTGSDEITIAAATGTGEANTASNVGTGLGLYKAKSGVDLQFRKLKAGTNITLSQVSDDIVITADTQTSGETNTASNVGTGAGVFAQKVGVDLQLKSIKAGTNVTITTTSTEITINAASGGGSGVGDDYLVTLGAGATIADMATSGDTILPSGWAAVQGDNALVDTVFSGATENDLVLIHNQTKTPIVTEMMFYDEFASYWASVVPGYNGAVRANGAKSQLCITGFQGMCIGNKTILFLKLV